MAKPQNQTKERPAPSKLKATELELAEAQRNAAMREALDNRVLVQFGEQYKRLDRFDADLAKRIAERTGLDLAKYELSLDTGEFLPVEAPKPAA